MTKRARYDGPYNEVDVIDSNSEEGVYARPLARVQKGHLLPEDVPAKIRDELLAGEDWSEVNQSEQSKQASEKPSEAPQKGKED